MKRLLIIRFSALGDVALLVPVVRAVAEQNPALHITMLSKQGMADLFADMPANVTFHGVNLKQQRLRDIVAELGPFDLVADMHDVWRSRYIRWAMRLKGAKVRSIRKGRLGRFLLTNKISPKALEHSILRYRDVLQSLGLDAPALQTPSRTEGKGVGIAPFAAHAGKCYPLDRMEQVVAMLSKRGESVVLFGSKQEAAVLERWAKQYKGVRSEAGKHSLREELELMKGLRVMVTMDSANMHLASLVGTRVVSVWGATHPKAGFLGFGQEEKDCVQRALDCRPCSIYGKKKCKYGDYRCLDIAPEEIIQRIG